MNIFRYAACVIMIPRTVWTSKLANSAHWLPYWIQLIASHELSVTEPYKTAHIVGLKDE